MSVQWWKRNKIIISGVTWWKEKLKKFVQNNYSIFTILEGYISFHYWSTFISLYKNHQHEPTAIFQHPSTSIFTQRPRRRLSECHVCVGKIIPLFTYLSKYFNVNGRLTEWNLSELLLKQETTTDVLKEGPTGNHYLHGSPDLGESCYSSH